MLFLNVNRYIHAYTHTYTNYIIFTFTVSKSVLKKLGVRPEWFENVEIPISIVEIFEGEEYPDVSLLDSDISFYKQFFQKEAWQRIEKSCKYLFFVSKG